MKVLSILSLSIFPLLLSAANPTVLKEGTDIHLKFAEDISSKTAQVDDPVAFVVAEDVVVAGTVVLKAGAKAAGRVAHVQKAGMLGKPGELNVRLDHVRVGDRKVKLRGNKSKEGEDKVTSAVVLTVLLGPVGLIKKGKNIDVRTGTPLNAYVDEDVAVGGME